MSDVEKPYIEKVIEDREVQTMKEYAEKYGYTVTKNDD